jgi:hypothetical protein
MPTINDERLGPRETTAEATPNLTLMPILLTAATVSVETVLEEPDLDILTAIVSSAPESIDVIDMFPISVTQDIPAFLIPPEPPPPDLVAASTYTTAVHLADHPTTYISCDPEQPPDLVLAGLPDDLDILPIIHAARLHDPTVGQADIGSNINATADSSILENYTTLAQPFNLLGADASANGMMCPGYGYYPLQFLQGSVERILMYYCPQLSEMRISPQHICAQSETPFSGFDIRCRDMNKASIRFFSPSGLHFTDAPLTRNNNLFYFTQFSF